MDKISCMTLCGMKIHYGIFFHHVNTSVLTSSHKNSENSWSKKNNQRKSLDLSNLIMCFIIEKKKNMRLNLPRWKMSWRNFLWQKYHTREFPRIKFPDANSRHTTGNWSNSKGTTAPHLEPIHVTKHLTTTCVTLNCVC